MNARVCITADDYGLAPAINAAIDALAESGAIDAVSVMVHPGAELAGARALADTSVATGLHLTLRGERSLLGLFAAAASRAVRRELRDEIERQLDDFSALGLRLDFVNSHEHAHLHPLLWPLVADAVEGRGVRYVRSAAHRRPSLSRAGALALSSSVAWRLRPLPGCTRLSPLGVDASARLGRDDVASLLDAAVPATDVRELVCHPAADDGLYGRAGEARHGEYDLLASGAVGELCDARSLVRGLA